MDLWKFLIIDYKINTEAGMKVDPQEMLFEGIMQIREVARIVWNTR